MKKKSIIIIFLLAIFSSLLICYFTIPNVDICYMYNGIYYTQNARDIKRTKLQVNGYDNIDSVQFLDTNTYYCYGKNSSGGWFLKVRNGQVESSVKEPSHKQSSVIKTIVFENNVCFVYSYCDNIEKSNFNDCILNVNFEDKNYTQIDIPNNISIFSGLALKNNLYFWSDDESPKLYVLNNSQWNEISDIDENAIPFVLLNSVHFSKNGKMYEYSSSNKEIKLSNVKNINADKYSNSSFPSYYSFYKNYCLVSQYGSLKYEDAEHYASYCAFYNVENGTTLLVPNSIGKYYSNAVVIPNK